MVVQVMLIDSISASGKGIKISIIVIITITMRQDLAASLLIVSQFDTIKKVQTCSVINCGFIIYIHRRRCPVFIIRLWLAGAIK